MRLLFDITPTNYCSSYIGLFIFLYSRQSTCMIRRILALHHRACDVVSFAVEAGQYKWASTLSNTIELKLQETKQCETHFAKFFHASFTGLSLFNSVRKGQSKSLKYETNNEHSLYHFCHFSFLRLCLRHVRRGSYLDVLFIIRGEL